MLSLALIPLGALMLLILMAITTKHRYSLATEKIQAQLEEQRENILAEDQENDRRLTLGLAAGTVPLGQLFTDYAKQRSELLPGINLDTPHTWTFEHLTSYLQQQYETHVSRQSRRELFRAALLTLLVLAIAGGLALAWYHFHSSPTAAQPLPAQATPAAVDPFDSFGAPAKAPQ